MKREAVNHKARWEKWKAKAYEHGIDRISKANSDVILQYLRDMELGLNVSSTTKRGPRSPTTLNKLWGRMVYLAWEFEKRFSVSVTDINEEQLLSFFSDLNEGHITTRKGKRFKSIDTLVKVFKAFWHWHQKRSRKNDQDISDITIDLHGFYKKPQWVYLAEDEIKQLCNSATFFYRMLIMFLYDSGIRSPSELINVKVSDLYESRHELHIKDEIVKKGSFGRRIKLMLSWELIQEHIRINQLSPDDYLFDIKPYTVNKYLKRLAVRVLGDKTTLAGKKTSEISMYDFRHNACCYWLPRYKSESALKYRFGWKKSERIHYYSELLGMRDTISEEDLLLDVTKTELEQKIMKLEQTIQILADKVTVSERALKIIDQESAGIIKQLQTMV